MPVTNGLGVFNSAAKWEATVEDLFRSPSALHFYGFYASCYTKIVANGGGEIFKHPHKVIALQERASCFSALFWVISQLLVNFSQMLMWKLIVISLICNSAYS